MMRYIIFVVLSAAVAFGQTPPKGFEVASIRPAAEQPPIQATVGVQINGSQVRISYLSLKDYIGYAYGIRLNQITGPDWLVSERFDIAAKLPDGAAQADVPEMMQSLLAERFRLKVHREMKEFPVYALEVAEGGLKVTQSAPADGLTGDRTPINISAGGSAAGIMINLGEGSYFALGGKGFDAKKVSMTILADMLTRFLDRPVVDMTNLKGAYDLVLELTPEDRLAMMVRSAVANGVVLPPQALALLDSGSNASLSDSLQKAGLTLEGRRAPLEVLVVDEIQRTPTEN